MENLLDLIVPLIFVAVFLVNSLSKADKNKTRGNNEPRAQGGGGADPLAELREEIRRRVEQNQQGRQPSAQIPAPARPSVAEPVLSAPSQSFQQMEQQRRALKQAADNREAAERMKAMQRMQEQVKEMQRRADAEKRRAASVTSGSPLMRGPLMTHRKSTANRYPRCSLVREVVRDLKHPASSRKAILNAEILGTPVGLRKPSQTQALWGS